MRKKKKKVSNEEKFANVEKLLREKELQEKSRELFEKVIKKATKPKQRGSK